MSIDGNAVHGMSKAVGERGEVEKAPRREDPSDVFQTKYNEPAISVDSYKTSSFSYASDEKDDVLSAVLPEAIDSKCSEKQFTGLKLRKLSLVNIRQKFSRPGKFQSETLAREVNRSLDGCPATSYNPTRPILPTEGLIKRKPVRSNGHVAAPMLDITNSLPVSTIKRKDVCSTASRAPITPSPSLMTEAEPPKKTHTLLLTDIKTSSIPAEIVYAKVQKEEVSMKVVAETQHTDTKDTLFTNMPTETPSLAMQSRKSLTQTNTLFVEPPRHWNNMKSRSCNNLCYSDSLSDSRDFSKLPTTMLQAQRDNNTQFIVERAGKTFNHHNLPRTGAGLIIPAANGHGSTESSIVNVHDDAQASVTALPSRLVPEEAGASGFSHDSPNGSISTVTVEASSRNILLSVRDYIRDGQLRPRRQLSAQAAVNIEHAEEGRDNEVLTKKQKKSPKKKMQKVKTETTNRIEGKEGQLGTNEKSGLSTEQLQVIKDLKFEKLKNENYQQYRVMKLRQSTKSEVIRYAKGDRYPPHPNHRRTWYSKNLWCMECKNRCGVCRQACCSYSEACYQVEYGTEAEKVKGMDLSSEINKWVGYLKDESTFLECSTCHDWACPECIGICPEQICQDRQCVRCKAYPFTKCDWH